MSERFPASVVRATPVVPSLSSAPGVWTMEQQLQAQAQGIWPLDPGTVDPYFENVSLLLHGDGTNGATNNTFLNTPPTGVGAYAVYFDGTGDYLTLPTTALLSTTGSFTIEAWVYPTSTNDGGIFYLLGNTQFAGVRIGYVGYFYLLHSSNGSGWAINSGSTGTAPINQWYHIAVTRNGNAGTFYINGVSVYTFTWSTLYSSTVNLIGAYQNTTYSALTGYISNARLVNGTALYTANFTPPTTPLTTTSQGATAANVSLLTCQSSTFIDNSTNAFAITVNGNTTITAASNATLAITRSGNVSQGSFSPFGTLWSNYFDGTGDYLIPAASGSFALGTGDFTIEGWIMPATVSGAQGIMGCGGAAANSWEVFANLTATKVTFNVYGGTAYVSSGSFTANTWNHFAIVRSAGVIKVYLNGVGNTGVANTTNFTVTDLVIGRSYYNLSQEHFTGNISNVRIVKSAVYSADFTPPGSPLTAISNTVLLTCQSNRFVDNSATGATITRNGDVAVSKFSPFSPTSPYDASVIGGSAYFDGTGDYLSLPAGASFIDYGTGDFNFEAWVYVTGSGATQTIAAARFWCMVGPTTFKLTSAGVADIVNLTGLANIQNQWAHVAVSRQSGTLRCFINGIVINTITGNTTNFELTSGKIGIESGSLINPFTGYITELRSVKGTAIYTSAFTPPTAPLSWVAKTTLLLSAKNAAIVDNAMQCNLETVGNAQISTSVTKYGTGSLYFDGTGDRLAAPINQSQLAFGAGDFTIEAWVYRTVSATQVILIGQADGNTVAGSSFVCYVGSANSDLYIGGTGYSATSPNPTLNTWAHVAYVRYGATWKTYLNGVQVGSVAVPATGAVNIGTATYPACIGGGGGGASVLTGYIDELRVTKGVARYTANFTPPAAPFNNQ